MLCLDYTVDITEPFSLGPQTCGHKLAVTQLTDLVVRS